MIRYNFLPSLCGIDPCFIYFFNLFILCNSSRRQQARRPDTCKDDDVKHGCPVPEYSFHTRNQVKAQMDSGPGPESGVSWDLEVTWAWKREPVNKTDNKTATLQKGHNQKGHTVLVQRATLLWSKRPHRARSLSTRPHHFWSKRPQKGVNTNATRRSYQNGHRYYSLLPHTCLWVPGF